MPGLCFVKDLAAAKASLPRTLDLSLLQGTGTLKDARKPFTYILPLFGITPAPSSTSG